MKHALTFALLALMAITASFGAAAQDTLTVAQMREDFTYISHESEAHLNNTILRTLFWFYQAFYGCNSQMVLQFANDDD